MSRYTARATVHAFNYQDAIGRVGDQMDALWGNGNWSLENCHATPLAYTQAGEVVTWKWDFDIEWLGLIKGAS